MSWTMSQESNAMLVELLTAEKDATRVWLRAEMDRLVDPMLDSIFNRLTTKLTKGMERTQSTGFGDRAQLFNPTARHRLPNHLPQLSTSFNPTSFHFNQNQHSFMNYQSQPPTNVNRPIPFNPLLQSTLQSSPLSQFPSSPVPNTQITLPNKLSSIKSRPIQIKHENETNEPINFNITITNEQSNHNSNDQNWEDDEDEDEEECDCEDCVNGGIDVKEEDEDEDDDVQLIDDNDQDGEELQLPLKRPKMYSVQPNNAQPKVTRPHHRKSHRNQVTKQFITIHLQCPHCPNTFPEDQLNQHMLDVHSIGPFQCLVKDCAQSFNTRYILQRHIKQVHNQTTQWHCDKCAKHFAKYQLLLMHNYHQHQLGQFQCSFPECTFTGECKGKVYEHYKQHKCDLVCQMAGCNFRTHKASDLRAHERVHLGIKPYRCKWPNCDYASSYHGGAMKHIRTHLVRTESMNQDVRYSVDPKDYLEVASELLLLHN